MHGNETAKFIQRKLLSTKLKLREIETLYDIQSNIYSDG